MKPIPIVPVLGRHVYFDLFFDSVVTKKESVKVIRIHRQNPSHALIGAYTFIWSENRKKWIREG